MIRWTPLTELSQLEHIDEASVSKSMLIFKHSTRCSISRMALKRFEQEYDIDEAHLECYFLDLLNHRDISNEIAQRWHVQHQSPQVLLIKNNKVIAHDSHDGIDANAIKRSVA